ncbi:MAG: DUF58 domain-containing protein [Alphaproteobacteria bacterium]|nr:DUF58 domain-containing protein [Alphaproteobacteria bacterium]
MVFKRWFGHRKNKKEENGLNASLDALMAMRKYTPFVQGFNRMRTFSCQTGDIKSAFKGRGIEFEEIRTYNFGDDVRDIDWRVTARKDVPYTKVYTEEKDHEVYVWLDLSAPMLFGSKKELKSVSASKLAALLGWLALENKDRFGCVIFNGRSSSLFKPQNSRTQLMAILKKMAKEGVEVLKNPMLEEKELVKSLKLLEQNAKNKATVFMISDFISMGDEVAKQLSYIAKRSQLYLINVFDALEENPPKAGEYMVEYLGKRLIFDSAPKGYKHDYFAYFAQKRKKLRDFCRRFNCRLAEFRTDMDIVKNLNFM